MTEAELKALPRKVGHMKDEVQVEVLLATCKSQIVQHDGMVWRGEPCPECRTYLARAYAPCAEAEALENAAREAERASRGGYQLSVLAARWRVEHHRWTCVTCQTVRAWLAIESDPKRGCTCPALKWLYAVRKIYRRRLNVLYAKGSAGDVRGAGV